MDDPSISDPKERRRAYARAYYLANREKICEKVRQREREYYAKDPERMREKSRKRTQTYRLRNQERLREVYEHNREFNREQNQERQRAYYLKNKERIREYREQNKEKAREYMHVYYRVNREELSQRRHEARQQGREKPPDPDARREIEQRSRAKYKDKIAARMTVKHAVESGKLIRPDRCQHCETIGKPQAHHHRGYAKEFHLDVVWLCVKCHKRAHRKL